MSGTLNMKWVKDRSGTRFYPITHLRAVRDGSGGNLEDLLDDKADASSVYTKTEIGNLITPVGTTVTVVTELPSSGTANTVYRVAGTTSYSDWGWDGTQFVKLAEYTVPQDGTYYSA